MIKKQHTSSWLWIIIAGTLWLLSFSSVAQSDMLSRTDSLLIESQKDNPPKIKFQKEIDFVKAIHPNDHDSALVLLDVMIEKYKGNGFDYALARSISMKSWFLAFKSKYEESIVLGHRALEIQKRHNDDTLGIGLTLNRIGIANIQFGRYPDAEKYIIEAKDVFIALRDTYFIDMAYNNLGVLYQEEGKFEKAIGFYQKSLALRKAQQNHFWVAYSFFNISEAYKELNEIDSLKKYILLSHETFTQNTETGMVPGMVSLGMGEYHFLAGNYADAMIYTQRCINRSEQLGHTEMILLGKEFLAKVLYEDKQYKRAYKVSKEYQSLKIKTDSLNNASQVAKIEEQFEHAKNERKIADLEADQLKTKNKLQHTRLTILYLLVGLAGISFFFFRKRQREKLHQSKIEAKLADLRLVALRAQMNPHFIFNCINTAQTFVLDANKEDAYEYLAKFARLLRLVLESSSKTYIPIEDEIKQLRLYVELESIRFSNKFDCDINIDPALENGVHEIPAMIIQAFVENAILHGLVNLTSRRGELRVSMQLQNELLLCEIEDNGVGRKAAREIKAQKQKHYQSHAIPNIRERLDIMQSNSEMNIELDITDLEFEGKPNGTLVKLEIPVR